MSEQTKATTSKQLTQQTFGRSPRQIYVEEQIEDEEV